MSPYTWALLAAACWGFAPLLEKAGLRGQTDPAVGVMIRSVGVVLGALCAIPFFSNLTLRLAATPTRSWMYLLAGGILASIVGQLFFYQALKTGEMSRVVPIGAAYPLITFVLGLLIFKESVTVTKTAGVALVMAGIFLLRK